MLRVLLVTDTEYFAQLGREDAVTGKRHDPQASHPAYDAAFRIWSKAYCRRERNGKVAWIGPIPVTRIDREVHAWRKAGWNADAIPATPAVRNHVNAWQRQQRKDRP